MASAGKVIQPCFFFLTTLFLSPPLKATNMGTFRMFQPEAALVGAVRAGDLPEWLQPAGLPALSAGQGQPWPAGQQPGQQGPTADHQTITSAGLPALSPGQDQTWPAGPQPGQQGPTSHHETLTSARWIRRSESSHHNANDCTGC